MRILACNPDTIGDVVLRQPLYGALREAGHDLMLTVRPLLTPLVGSVAPGARVLPIPVNAYDAFLSPGSESLDGMVEAAAEFDPDVVLVAPFQWTAVEERLARDLKRARVVMMTGRKFIDPQIGVEAVSTIQGAQRVEVAEQTPELRKNELLASALLGRALKLGDPKVEPDESHLRAAEAELSRLGLKAGEYWIACVGETEPTRVRNWRLERWGTALGAWAKEHGRRFLLAGMQGEQETSRSVRAHMGEQSGMASEWFGLADGELDVLTGLTALAGGYVGRDTGPMHMAAALGKPVLAVFGGGTWPRFLPASDRSISITMGVPCAGCGWVCHLPESYCIKEVPAGEVLRGAGELERGEVSQRQVRVLKPDEVLLHRIGREGAASAREKLAQAGVARRDGAAGISARAELDRLRLQLEGLNKRLAEAEAQKQAAFSRYGDLRDNTTESKARMAALEKRLEDRAADLLAARSELAGARAQITALQEKTEELRFAVSSASNDLIGTRRQLEFVQQELGAARQQLKSREEELKTTATALDEAYKSLGGGSGPEREESLRKMLAEARSQAARAQSDLKDLQLRVSRFQSDQAMLTGLTRKQEGELVTLRSRLNDLMASRWRKVGQRIGVAKTLPWERESHNGQH